MSDLRSILLKAGEASLAIDAKKAAVDAVKLLLEAARAEVEVAKADFDAVIEECEAAGLPKAKAKNAIEALNQVFADAGIVETAQDSATEADKAIRKKRKSKNAEEAPNEVSSTEATSSTSPELPVETEALETSTSIDTAQSFDAPVKVDLADLPFVVELFELIDEKTGNSDERSRGAATFLKELSSAIVRAYPYDYFEVGYEHLISDFNIEQIERILVPGVYSNVDTSSIVAALTDDRAESVRIIDWFHDVLTALEDGKDHKVPLFIKEAPISIVVEPVEATVVVEPEATAPVALAAQVEAEAVAVVDVPAAHNDDYIDFADADDEFDTADGNYDGDDVISDDETFPIEGDEELSPVENGQVVSDIEIINFLDGGDEDEAIALPVEAPAPEPETAPALPPRGKFKPPAFLMKS